MSWLPRISFHGWCSCESDDATFEGWALQVRWFCLIFEVALGRRDREFDVPTERKADDAR